MHPGRTTAASCSRCNVCVIPRRCIETRALHGQQWTSKTTKCVPVSQYCRVHPVLHIALPLFHLS